MGGGGLTQSGIREGFSEEVALMRNLQDAWKGASQKEAASGEGPSRQRERHKQRP